MATYTLTHRQIPRTVAVISVKLTRKSACLPNFDYSLHISKWCACVYVRAHKFAIVCIFLTMVDGLLTLNEQYFLISMEFHSFHVCCLFIFFSSSSIQYALPLQSHCIHIIYIYDVCSSSNAKISLLGKC